MSELHARAALADRCPLCGEANGCAIAAGSAGRCWCSDASFSAAVRERATNAGGALRCICARCSGAAAVAGPAAATAVPVPR